VFVRLLREPLGLGLDVPKPSPLVIAFYRGLFGGLVLLALVRRRHLTYHRLMPVMVVTFTVMSGLYLSALGLGAAANAIFLQNTAPVWVYLFAVLLRREPADRRGWQAALLAAAGAAVIVAGGWPRDLAPEERGGAILVLFMGVGSGMAYAAVVLFLRALRDHAAVWLVTINLLGTALTLGLFVLVTDGPAGFAAWALAPSAAQFGVLVAAGALQMAVPYWLFCRGLRTVSPQEAALITLIEPLLNPVWAYLLTPEKDTPTWATAGGGALILLALVWKYLPGKKEEFTTESQRPQREDKHRENENS
jgi:drug/metabolite transporter (DMT)-like permease